MLTLRAHRSDLLLGRLRPAHRAVRRHVWATILLGTVLGMPAIAVEPEDEEAVREPETFLEQLERVNQAVRTNPNGISRPIVESCVQRRSYAMGLYNEGQERRALRNLGYCLDALGIPKEAPRPARPEAGRTIEQIQAAAAEELEKALALTPDLTRGLEIYRNCALCHEPEGFGLPTGTVPQIAGQHRSVVIKQLADMRAGNRDAVPMLPYASIEAIGGAQAVADVAGYVDTLEISTTGGKGDGTDLEHGARVYASTCAHCHGERGEGNADRHVPRIQSQHYRYMERQFEWIRTGKRRRSHTDMQAEIQDLGERDVHAALDYVSRLEPPPELQAPPGWHNPDFAEP